MRHESRRKIRTLMTIDFDVRSNYDWNRRSISLSNDVTSSCRSVGRMRWSQSRNYSTESSRVGSGRSIHVIYLRAERAIVRRSCSNRIYSRMSLVDWYRQIYDDSICYDREALRFPFSLLISQLICNVTQHSHALCVIYIYIYIYITRWTS